MIIIMNTIIYVYIVLSNICTETQATDSCLYLLTRYVELLNHSRKRCVAMTSLIFTQFLFGQ